MLFCMRDVSWAGNYPILALMTYFISYGLLYRMCELAWRANWCGHAHLNNKTSSLVSGLVSCYS